MALYTTWLVLAGFLFEKPLPPPDAAALDAAISDTVAHKDLAGLTVGLAVACADDKDGAIVGHGADTPMNPASGTKLLTSAAALARFAPTHRFRTSFFGDLDGDTVTGDLVIRPAGDPSMQRKSYTTLAKAIKSSGVAIVRGDVVIDVSAFPTSAMPPAYDQKNSDAAYRPAVPPVGIDDGALRVTVTPAKTVGAPPSVSVTPASARTVIDVTAVTVDGKGIGDLTVTTSSAGAGATRVTVGGKIGVKAPKQGVRRRMQDPMAFAIEAIAAALKKAGVRINGETRATTKRTTVSGAPLGHFDGAPLSAIIAEINIHSNNYWAEALFRMLGLGADGTMQDWKDAATSVTRTLVDAYGLKDYDFAVVNGSGLYDATRISPAAMVRLLRALAGPDAKSAALRDSLALAGESGTLKTRLKDLKGMLRGKTGTLDNAISLSGYLKRPKGCALAFATIVEGDIGDKAARVRAVIDTWLRRLAAP